MTDGQAVRAFGVMREGQKESEDLAADLQDLIRGEVEYVEELPTTPTGKIRRNVLREREGAKG